MTVAGLTFRAEEDSSRSFFLFGLDQKYDNNDNANEENASRASKSNYETLVALDWRWDHKDIISGCACCWAEKSSADRVLSSIQLGSLSYWCGVIVVDKHSEIVGEELASENCLVVAWNLRIELSNEKSALSVDVACESGKWNNKVGGGVFLEGNLETELPEGGVSWTLACACAVASSLNAAGEGRTSDNIQQADKGSVWGADQTEAEEVHVEAGAILRGVNKKILIVPLSGALSLSETETKYTGLASWKLVSASCLISSKRQVIRLSCVVRIIWWSKSDIGSLSNIGGGAKSCTCGCRWSSADHNRVGLSVGGNIGELSYERWVGSNTKNTASACNTIEPLVSDDLIDYIDADNLASCLIVETDFIQNYYSTSNVAAESESSKWTDNLVSVICETQGEICCHECRKGWARLICWVKRLSAIVSPSHSIRRLEINSPWLETSCSRFDQDGWKQVSWWRNDWWSHWLNCKWICSC